ncbi:MAG: Ig-like domain-containing protein [Phycicoccus sp.]
MPASLRRLDRHRLLAAALVVAFGASAAAVVSHGPIASADPAPLPDPVSFTTPGPYSGIVPDGVCAVRPTVLGAAGGHNMSGGGVSAFAANGAGARIFARYTVVPGMTYSGTVGGGGRQAATSGNAGGGGSNGGGDGGLVTGDVHPGSGGGGWTDLQLGGSLVVLAGGGGGSGGGYSTSSGFGGNAGLPGAPGVTAGSDGGDGTEPSGGAVGGGRGGGTSVPGAGGVNGGDASRNGTAGGGRTGGDGGRDTDPDSGGGGGGGWFGAGGGSSTTGAGSGVPVAGGVTGSGGGGGSSFVAAISPDGSGSAVSDLLAQVGPRRATAGAGADGSVTLSWVLCDYDLQIEKQRLTPATARAGETITWQITIRNVGPQRMTRGSTVTLRDNLDGNGPKTIDSISTFLLTPPGPGPGAPLVAGPITCDAGQGDPMPAVLECSRPYSASSTPGAPSGGTRGLDVGEGMIITYSQNAAPPAGRVSNVASVTDRATPQANNTASASVEVVANPPVANPDTSSGTQSNGQQSLVLENDTPSDPTVPIDPASLTLLDANGDAVSSLLVPGQGFYDVTDLNGAWRVRFSPDSGFTGTADPVTYRITDVAGLTATSTYTATVTPILFPDTSTGPQGVPQSVDPLANDDPSVVALALVDDVTGAVLDDVVVAGQGTYTVVDGRIVFTPLPTFVGTATPATYRALDGDNPVTSTYTPTVTAVTPRAEADASSGPQGVAQSVDPLANDGAGDPAVPLDPATLTLLDDAGDPAPSVTVPGQGTYTIDGGRIVFTPLPALTGPADPVTYRVADVNGTSTSTTYTPTVTAVTPAAEPDVTSGPQGARQSVDPLANDNPGNPAVPFDPATLTLLNDAGEAVDSVTVPGQGTYAVAGGRIVFIPRPGFTGTADPITYRIANLGGATTTSTYTPTLITVLVPDRTTGPQGLPQSVDPLTNDDETEIVADTLTLLDGDGNPVNSVTVPGQGSYTVVTGRIVFTPLAGFVGAADPVTYQVDVPNPFCNPVARCVDPPATSTYTPTVSPVRPSAAPDTSRGPQGAAQSVDPLANDDPGDPAVPLDQATLTLLDDAGDPVSSVTVPRQGTYTLDGGRIVFTPLPGFTGTATPVTYRIADANGTTARSIYTPTALTGAAGESVTVLVRAPVGTMVILDPSEEIPGLVPSSVRLTGPDGVQLAELVVAGEGRWTVDTATGLVTFTPEPGFTDDPTPVEFTAVTDDGTPVTGDLVVDYVELGPPPAQPEPPLAQPGEPPARPEAPLAATGATVGSTLSAAVLLVILGIALRRLTRRRGRASSSPFA